MYKSAYCICLLSCLMTTMLFSAPISLTWGSETETTEKPCTPLEYASQFPGRSYREPLDQHHTKLIQKFGIFMDKWRQTAKDNHSSLTRFIAELAPLTHHYLFKQMYDDVVKQRELLGQDGKQDSQS